MAAIVRTSIRPSSRSFCRRWKAFTISSEAKLNGVIFFDYGKGFDDNESVNFNRRPTAGIEGRWIAPFGPLRAAYGINLDPNPNERKGVFEFTIGSLF